MHELVLTPKFERAFRKLVRKTPSLQAQIELTLQRMAEDLSDPRLKTHHLSGQLAGLHACSVAYDCRIVFSKQKRSKWVRKFYCSPTSARTRKSIELARTERQIHPRFAAARRLVCGHGMEGFARAVSAGRKSFCQSFSPGLKSVHE